MKLSRVWFQQGVSVDGKPGTVQYYNASDGVDMELVSSPAAVRLQVKDGPKGTFPPTFVPMSNIRSYAPVIEAKATPAPEPKPDEVIGTATVTAVETGDHTVKLTEPEAHVHAYGADGKCACGRGKPGRKGGK